MRVVAATPIATTDAPVGGVVSIVDLGAEGAAVFGDDSIQLGVDGNGRPTASDAQELPLSRWVAESSSPGMFEVLGTWLDDDGPAQGLLAAGTSTNYLLLTNTTLRGSVPAGGWVRTATGLMEVAHGHVYVFAMPLAEIEVVDGNKRDIAVAAAMEGLRVQWTLTCDSAWNKAKSGNPWHKDNASFAQAVVAATIAAKRQHEDQAVRASAEAAARKDLSQAFAKGRRTTFEFAAPTDPAS